MCNVEITAELRGITEKTSSKTGKKYFVVNLESSDGEPFTLCAKEYSPLQNLAKGKTYIFVCDLYMGRNMNLTIISVKEVSK